MNVIATIGIFAACASYASAIIVPFNEPFSGPAANWSSAASFSPLTYVAAGGPDGSAYATRPTSFAANGVGEFPILFRAQSNFNSSNNAFVGDWIASGVATFTYSVRHHAATPVDFFARFGPSAGPGAVALAPVSLPPNQWMTFTIPIDPSTPFIYEGTSFAAFANIARVQVGVIIDPSLAGQAGPFAFDIDNVGITPAPGTAGLLVIAAGLLRRRAR